MLRRSGGTVSRRRGNKLVADPDFAGARLDESGDQPQRRGLAAARRAQQADQMTVLDRERYVVDHRGRAISLGQIPQFDRRHALPSLTSPLARGCFFGTSVSIPQARLSCKPPRRREFMSR